MEVCEGAEMAFATTFNAPTPERTVPYRDKWQAATNIFTPQGLNVLDHVITHTQWLPIILDVRSRPDV